MMEETVQLFLLLPSNINKTLLFSKAQPKKQHSTRCVLKHEKRVLCDRPLTCTTFPKHALNFAVWLNNKLWIFANVNFPNCLKIPPVMFNRNFYFSFINDVFSLPVSCHVTAWLREEYANSVRVVRWINLQYYRTVPHTTLLSLRTCCQGRIARKLLLNWLFTLFIQNEIQYLWKNSFHICHCVELG